MPSPSTTIQRPDLEQTIMGFDLEASRRGFAALSIYPLFRTMRQSGNFLKFSNAELVQTVDTKRAPKSAYNRGDFHFTQDNYACTEKGWEEPIDDAEARNFATYFDAEVVATMRAMDIILRAQEARVRTVVEALSGTAGTASWAGAPTTAVPLADVMAGRKAIHDATGVWPNLLSLPYATYRALLATTEIKDAFKYTTVLQTQNEPAKLRQLADYFEIPQVVVADAVTNSNGEGLTFSAADMWNDDMAFMCIANTSQDLKAPSFGRTFLWTDDSPENATVESYREEQVRGDVIRVRQQTDEKTLNSACGYLITGLD